MSTLRDLKLQRSTDESWPILAKRQSRWSRHSDDEVGRVVYAGNIGRRPFIDSVCPIKILHRSISGQGSSLQTTSRPHPHFASDRTPKCIRISGVVIPKVIFDFSFFLVGNSIPPWTSSRTLRLSSSVTLTAIDLGLWGSISYFSLTNATRSTLWLFQILNTTAPTVNRPRLRCWSPAEIEEVIDNWRICQSAILRSGRVPARCVLQDMKDRIRKTGTIEDLLTQYLYRLNRLCHRILVWDWPM